MSKKPPNRPGITFEIGARLEALDYLQKWYEKYRTLAKNTKYAALVSQWLS